MNRFFHLITLLLCACLAACGTDTGSSGSDSVSSIGDGLSGDRPGLTLRLTDAPFDEAVGVMLTFVEVRMRKKGGGGWVSPAVR
jgi:hypothetical protein